MEKSASTIMNSAKAATSALSATAFALFLIVDATLQPT
jgi:hypothetical protein